MTSLQHNVQPRMGASTLIEGHIGGWNCHWSLTPCHWVTMPRDIVQAMPAIMIRPHWASGTVVALRMAIPVGSVDDMLLSQMPAIMIRPQWASGTVVTLRMVMPVGSVDDMLLSQMPAIMIRPQWASGTVVALRMVMPMGNVDDMLLRYQCFAIKCELRQPFPNVVGKLQRNSSGFLPPYAYRRIFIYHEKEVVTYSLSPSQISIS
jgi:hypothetical protein